MLLSMAIAQEYPGRAYDHGNREHFERSKYFDKYHFEQGDEKDPFLHRKAREKERFLRENERDLRHLPKEGNNTKNPDVPVNKEDSLALVALYNSTDGDHWNNNNGWLTDNVSQWYGITINDSGRVTKISLSDNNLSGAIPSEIGNLVKLEWLYLGSNKLIQIPPEIGNLVKLTRLGLDENQLTQIPPEIGNLGNLAHLFFEGNQLTQIPPEIGNLVKLEWLYLGSNKLTQIPPEFGNLLNLSYLNLCYNQLAQIPPEIENLTNLSELYFFHNQLTQIPPEIGNLSNLTNLNLVGNQLTQIPPEIGNLGNLEWLRLIDNQLTQIPPEIGNLGNLIELSLNINQLAQIPPEIGNLANLIDLNLDINQLKDLPDLSGMNNLLSLNVMHNKLTFEDIEPYVSIPNFYYAPQAKVGIKQFFHPLEGTTVNLSINVGGSANSYQWYKGNIEISGATDSIFIITAYSATDKDIYTCKIKNSIATELTLKTENYFVGFETAKVNLYAVPEEGGTVEGGGTYAIIEYATITATANEQFRFVNWQENDTVVSTNIVYHFLANKDRNLVAHFKNVTGIIQKSAEDNLIIYPNPVQNTIFIKLKNKNLKNKLSEIRIVNLNGKTVLKEKRKISASGSSSLDISALPAGLYFVQITGNAKQVHTGKFVKE
jgi:Leucine-rich repeat (LRR) protein